MWTNNFFLILSMLGDAQANKPIPPQSLIAPLLEPAPHVTAAKLVAEPLVTPRPTKVVTPKRPKRVAVAPVVVPAPVVMAPLPAPVPSKPAPRVAVAGSADEAIGKVQDFYNTTKSFSATFTQTVKNQTFNKLKPKVSKGKVYILKPGKMRWDYKNKSYKTKADPKVSKSFISDGKHLWAVMHKNKQYYKENLSGSTLPVAVSFLMGTGDLRKEFTVAFDTAGKFGSKSDLLLVLTPKTPSARYKKLWLVVDPKDHSVKQSIVLNSKGDTNAIRFSSIAVNNGKLKAGHFIFNAKANKGFRLIKPPKAKGAGTP